MTKPEREEKRAYFDVERFRKVLSSTSRPMNKWGKSFRKITRFFDSMQGFFIIMFFFLPGFAVFGAIWVGTLIGPLGFLGVMGGLIGGACIFVERKVGRSLQFNDYNSWKRTVGLSLAFILTVGGLFLLLFLSRTITRVFG